MWAELGDYLLVYTDQDDNEFARRDDVSTGESVGLSAPTFNTVSDLVAGLTFSGETVNTVEGTICRTEGESTVRDSRASDWIIIATGPTIDNYKYFELDNGLVAERLTNIVSGIQTCSFLINTDGSINKQISSNSTQLDLVSGVQVITTGFYQVDFNYPAEIFSSQVTLFAVNGFIRSTWTTGFAVSKLQVTINDPALAALNASFQITVTFKV